MAGAVVEGVGAAGTGASPSSTIVGMDVLVVGYLAALVSGVEDEAERLRRTAVAGALSTRGTGGTGSQASRAEMVPR